MNQAQLLKSFREFWLARNARERRILSAGTVVVLCALVYSLLIDPAISGRDRLHKELPELRQQVAQLQAMAREAASLAGQPASAIPSLSREDIEAAMTRNGLKPQSLTLAGGVAQIKLASASFSDTMTWLDEIQKSQRLAVTEADLISLSEPDRIDATFTLRQPRQE